jgi:hypothetical protein
LECIEMNMLYFNADTGSHLSALLKMGSMDIMSATSLRFRASPRPSAHQAHKLDSRSHSFIP